MQRINCYIKYMAIYLYIYIVFNIFANKMKVTFYPFI